MNFDMDINFKITSNIIDNKKSYGKKTISKYTLDKIYKVIVNHFLNNDAKNVLYFVTELHASGKFDTLWNILFYISFKYIHILNPYLPFTLFKLYNKYLLIVQYYTDNNMKKIDLRNSQEYREILWKISKILSYSPKSLVNNFIPNQYLDTEKDMYDLIGNVFDDKIPEKKMLEYTINLNNSDDILFYINEFKKCLNELYINKSNDINVRNNLYYWLGKIINTGSIKSILVGYPYNVSLYHKVTNNNNIEPLLIIWNLYLNLTKKNKILFKQIVSLYKIFNNLRTQKKNLNPNILKYLLINTSLYFTNDINWENSNILNIYKNIGNYKKIDI